MSDRILLIFWNELSIGEMITDEELLSDAKWKTLAQRSFAGLFGALKHRADVKVSFTRGALQHAVGTKPLQAWLEIWLGKDAIRKIKSSAVQPVQLDSYIPTHELEIELRCADQIADGITRAHIAGTWTWSLGEEGAAWGNHHIDCQLISIHDEQSHLVQVRNISCHGHAENWKEELLAWGKVVADSHVVGRLADYVLVMYPLDHGYPHIHVHYSNGEYINAKYRIDCFECLTESRKRPDGLDSLVEKWIEENRTDLLTSWRRCTGGLYPLRLG